MNEIFLFMYLPTSYLVRQGQWHEVQHLCILYFDYCPGYFGGITSFSEKQFREINGFPNNFWGWGGEDDELYKRTKLVSTRLTPLL